MLVKYKLLLLTVLLTSFGVSSVNTFTGTWQYSGGIYNGKPESAPKDYTLRRQYAGATYTALLLEKGEESFVYEKGDYTLTQDSCLETQTFSAQPSKVLNITIKYRYRVHNDTLTFSGVLPNGTTVQEDWKRVK